MLGSVRAPSGVQQLQGSRGGPVFPREHRHDLYAVCILHLTAQVVHCLWYMSHVLGVVAHQFPQFPDDGWVLFEPAEQDTDEHPKFSALNYCNSKKLFWECLKSSKLEITIVLEF